LRKEDREKRKGGVNIVNRSKTKKPTAKKGGRNETPPQRLSHSSRGKILKIIKKTNTRSPVASNWKRKNQMPRRERNK